MGEGPETTCTDCLAKGKTTEQLAHEVRNLQFRANAQERRLQGQEETIETLLELTERLLKFKVEQSEFNKAITELVKRGRKS